MQILRKVVKFAYFFLFLLTKKLRYPHCIIETNFILPGVKLGKGVIIRPGVKIYQNIRIGDHSFINENTRLDPGTESIGKYCSISHDVKIGIGPHPLDLFSTSPFFYMKHRGLVSKDLYDELTDKGYTTIGHDVFIAANSIVLSGITISHGAVVAAGSVVTKDVPPYAVVGGVPARIIKYRFDEATISRLLLSQWWDKDIDILRKYAHLGFDIHAFLDGIERDSTK